jgi:large subunit ribosomal protein L17
MITLGKDGSLASRRRALAFIFDEQVVEKVFTEYAPRYKSRAGGYTRVLKLDPAKVTERRWRLLRWWSKIHLRGGDL